MTNLGYANFAKPKGVVLIGIHNKQPRTVGKRQTGQFKTHLSSSLNEQYTLHRKRFRRQSRYVLTNS